jgi:hypothetical protein
MAAADVLGTNLSSGHPVSMVPGSWRLPCSALPLLQRIRP